MVRAKGTTPKSLQFKMKQEGAITNYGGGESSFRVLYYGDAAAGSVPFMWESRPGTPKQPTTESSLPPLTPPPAVHHFDQRYNSLKQETSLRALFLFTSSRKISDSFISYDSPSRQSTSLHSLFLASSSDEAATPSYASLRNSLPSTPPMSRGQGKRVFGRSHAAVKFGMEEHGSDDGSSTVKLCFGGGFMKVCYGMKKVKSALMSKSIGSHGKIHNS